jgi:hypothetical protein
LFFLQLHRVLNETGYEEKDDGDPIDACGIDGRGYRGQMVGEFALDMIAHIAVQDACYEELHKHGHPQHIKQPDAPLGILLVNISKVAHDEEDGHEISDADVLEQITEIMTIVVACRGGVHALNVAIDENCLDNGYNHKESRSERILYCIAKQIDFAHSFIVLI